MDHGITSDDVWQPMDKVQQRRIQGGVTLQIDICIRMSTSASTLRVESFCFFLTCALGLRLGLGAAVCVQGGPCKPRTLHRVRHLDVRSLAPAHLPPSNRRPQGAAGRENVPREGSSQSREKITWRTERMETCLFCSSGRITGAGAYLDLAPLVREQRSR